MGSVGNNQSTAVPFKRDAEIFRQDREGWTFGKTSTGSIWVGDVSGTDFFEIAPDTSENRKRLEDIWKANSFAKEVYTENRGFRDGDTAAAIIDTVLYRVVKTVGSQERDYGKLYGSDVKPMLAGYHYEELVPGDGMWFRKGGGSRTSYDIRRVE